MSFHSYFRETRLRCYIAFAAKQNKKATNVQMAYLFACLEEMRHPSFINPKNPCAARSAFIEELMKKPKNFKVHGKSTTMMLLAKVSQQMAEFRRKNMNGVIKCLFTSFVDETGTDLGEQNADATAEYIPKKPKHRKRSNKGKQPAATASEDEGDAMDIDTPDPNTFFDAPINEHIVINGRPLAGLRKDHPILDKLMQWYPGYVCMGDNEYKGAKGDPDALLKHAPGKDDEVLDELSDSLSAAKMSDDDILRYLRDDYFLISQHHKA